MEEVDFLCGGAGWPFVMQRFLLDRQGRGLVTNCLLLLVHLWYPESPACLGPYGYKQAKLGLGIINSSKIKFTDEKHKFRIRVGASSYITIETLFYLKGKLFETPLRLLRRSVLPISSSLFTIAHL